MRKRVYTGTGSDTGSGRIDMENPNQTAQIRPTTMTAGGRWALAHAHHPPEDALALHEHPS